MAGPWTNLTVDVDESGAADVRIDRPPANAVNRELMDDLIAVCHHLERLRPKVVTLRSDRPRIFVAGADLDMTASHWGVMADTVMKFQGAVNAWENLTAPTIAVIDGHALGGGCEIALACDLRVMTVGAATIGLPEVKWSLLASGGGTQRLARLVGRGHALNLVLRGLRIGAREAERIGLVTIACAGEDLDKAVADLVSEFVGLPPLAVSAAKRAILQGLEVSLADGQLIEREEMARLADTSDAREGVLAFQQKRDPHFTGR